MTEPKREHFRAMILYDFKSGLSATDSRDRLHKAFGDSAPSQATVYNWHLQFRRGEQSLEDEPRSGRPHEAVTPENISRTLELIHQDRRIIYEQLEIVIGIGSAAVQTIITDHLHLRKLVSRWVPHSLSEDQKNTRVEWCEFMLEKYENGKSKRVWDIITGDESWIYNYETPKLNFSPDSGSLQMKRCQRKFIEQEVSGRE
jgi:histone-lysine N-methyltransferase SETMAR